jgi:hypothetical protein
MDDADALRAFIVSARRHIYAGDGGDVPAVLAGTRQHEYAASPRRYRDIYLGGERFAGQETVYEDDRPTWTMVYGGGRWPESDLDARTIYAFLRAALLATADRCRLPGRATHGEEALRYTSTTAGTFEWFEGSEEIRHRGVVIYRLTYAGGYVR